MIPTKITAAIEHLLDSNLSSPQPLAPPPPRVLVVDDVPANLALMRHVLEGGGYEVALAEDGPEALANIKAKLPDLILLDIMMPGMDGFEVCQRLKADEATRNIPVLFMTALSDIEDKTRGFDSGGVDYIVKPINTKEVLARVGAHVKLRAVQAALEAQNTELRGYRTQLEQLVAERTEALTASNRRLRLTSDALRSLATRREAAREEERRRIARELHDELGQQLTALRFGMGMVDFKYGASNPELHGAIAELLSLVEKTVQTTRDVSSSLRPAALDLGLVAALEWLVADCARHSDIAYQLKPANADIKMSEEIAIVVFRIVQESLTNAMRHSKAHHVEVSLGTDHDQLLVEVRDDGIGFDPEEDVVKRRCFGLVGIRERALAVGGEAIISSAPSRGTVVQVRIPFESNKEEAT